MYLPHKLQLAVFMTIVGLLHACLALADLRWISGDSNIKVLEARACTLVFRPPADRSPLATWRLAWVAEGRGITSLPLLEDAGAPPEAGRVCEHKRARSPASLASNTDTTVHCAGGTTALQFRYVLNVRAGQHVRIAAILEDGGEASLAGEATTNNGIEAPYPPVIVSTSVVRNGSRFDATVDGIFLGDAWVAQPPWELTARTSSRLHLTAPVGDSPSPPPIALRTHPGNLTVVEPALVPAPEDRSDPMLVVRFRPGAVQRRAIGSGPLPLVSFDWQPNGLQQELAARGIIALEPAFPQFRKADVHTLNDVGEPIVLKDLSDHYIAHLAGAAPAEVRDQLDGLPGVSSVGVDESSGGLLALPGDYDAAQWCLANYGQTYCNSLVTTVAGYDIGMEPVWDRRASALSIPIGIMDSGVDSTHVEFRAPPIFPEDYPVRTRVIDAPHFTTETRIWVGNHGTIVAGMAAANTSFESPGGSGGYGSIAGIAHDATIWSYQITQDTLPRPNAIAQALDHARSRGIRIINMSLQVIPTPSLHDAVRNAATTGMLLLAAPGNQNLDVSGCPSYPSGYRTAAPPVLPATSHRVCTVGAVWANGNRWMDFFINTSNCDEATGDCTTYPPPLCAGSDFGSHIDLGAPGGAFVIAPLAGSYSGYIASSSPCRTYQPWTWGIRGTSISPPQVAGVAALLKGSLPILTGEDIEQVLKRTTMAIYAPQGVWEHFLGYGLVRADRALDYVSERVFNHRRVTFTPSQYGQLMSVDSLPNVDVLFRNDPVIPHNQVFSTIPYRIRGVVRYRFPYQANPDVWTRMSGTRGSRMLGVIDDFEVVDWARIDSTQVARDSALVETYVYRIPALNNTWYPVPPESVAVAITVAGFPEGTADVDALDAPRIVGVYPNPAREKVDLQIDGAHTGNRRVSVYDAMGRRVVRLEVPPDVSRVRWDLRDAAGAPVAAGLYWLRVDGHRDLLRRRVIILR